MIACVTKCVDFVTSTKEGTTIENASFVPLDSYSSTTSRYGQQDFELLRYYSCPSSPTINILTVIGLMMYLACFVSGLCCNTTRYHIGAFPLWARSAGMASAQATISLFEVASDYVIFGHQSTYN